MPTLAAGPALLACLGSLERQTFKEYEVIVVDNSGRGLARKAVVPGLSVAVLENEANVGFGAAVNQGFERSSAPYLATLNDDAEAGPEWLAALVAAMEARPDAGMCASRVILAGDGRLDSAGMLLAADGSSKQRGHLEPPSRYDQPCEVLFPSGSAALYRRAMLERTGGFDPQFFLYCEDVDLGLRARWAGWKCLYVPAAQVAHRYSHSAGRASPLKAYYVERNRLFAIAKNFPAAWLARAPLAALARYAWHVVSIWRGRGAAARYRGEGNSAARLVWFVARAHLALLGRLRRLWRERRAIRRGAAITSAQFGALLRAHSISAREVAEL